MKPAKAPRDDKGHFVPIACPDINCSGTLRYEGEGRWRCDGLVDPNHDDKPLYACPYVHFDGEPLDIQSTPK
jgi:hypothetical protein